MSELSNPCHWKLPPGTFLASWSECETHLLQVSLDLICRSLAALLLPGCVMSFASQVMLLVSTEAGGLNKRLGLLGPQFSL